VRSSIFCDRILKYSEALEPYCMILESLSEI